MRRTMRTYLSTVFRFFFTGVLTIAPLVVTVFFLAWIIRLADSYVGPSSSLGLFLAKIFGAGHPYAGYVVGYVILVLALILLGFLVTRATVARFHEAIDSTFSRIPLVGKIYAGVGQVVELLGRKDQGGLDRFGGVVEIQMGNVRMLALLTSNERYVSNGQEHVLVFVPNSPIPATGFNMLVPADQARRLDISVEELAKLLMSLGLLGAQVLPRAPAEIAMREGQNEGRPTP